MPTPKEELCDWWSRENLSDALLAFFIDNGLDNLDDIVALTQQDWTDLSKIAAEAGLTLPFGVRKKVERLAASRQKPSEPTPVQSSLNPATREDQTSGANRQDTTVSTGDHSSPAPTLVQTSIDGQNTEQQNTQNTQNSQNTTNNTDTSTESGTVEKTDSATSKSTKPKKQHQQQEQRHVDPNSTGAISCTELAKTLRSFYRSVTNSAGLTTVSLQPWLELTKKGLSPDQRKVWDRTTQALLIEYAPVIARDSQGISHLEALLTHLSADVTPECRQQVATSLLKSKPDNKLGKSLNTFCDAAKGKELPDDEGQLKKLATALLKTATDRIAAYTPSSGLEDAVARLFFSFVIHSPETARCLLECPVNDNVRFSKLLTQNYWKLVALSYIEVEDAVESESFEWLATAIGAHTSDAAVDDVEPVVGDNVEAAGTPMLDQIADDRVEALVRFTVRGAAHTVLMPMQVALWNETLLALQGRRDRETPLKVFQAVVEFLDRYALAVNFLGSMVEQIATWWPSGSRRAHDEASMFALVLKHVIPALRRPSYLPDKVFCALIKELCQSTPSRVVELLDCCDHDAVGNDQIIAGVQSLIPTMTLTIAEVIDFITRARTLNRIHLLEATLCATHLVDDVSKFQEFSRKVWTWLTKEWKVTSRLRPVAAVLRLTGTGLPDSTLYRDIAAAAFDWLFGVPESTTGTQTTVNWDSDFYSICDILAAHDGCLALVADALLKRCSCRCLSWLLWLISHHEEALAKVKLLEVQASVVRALDRTSTFAPAKRILQFCLVGEARSASAHVEPNVLFCQTLEKSVGGKNNKAIEDIATTLKRFPDKLKWLHEYLARSGAIASAASKADWSKVDAETVLTASTKTNIELVLQSAIDGTPLLLLGESGTSKTFSVDQAAKLMDKSLSRITMHSQMSDDELFGKNVATGTEVAFVLQPFAVAFFEGKWIVLDEMNLAPASVFLRIETALATGQLSIGTKSLQRHPDFRFFATLNPDVGKWAGKRAKLSSSFLSHFRQLRFVELPDSELEEILSSPKHLGEVSLSKRIVSLASKIRENLRSKAPIETGAHVEITVRDVLRFSDSINQLKAITKQCNAEQSAQTMTPWVAWCVFGARFRSASAQKRIREWMSTCGIDGITDNNAKWIDDIVERQSAKATPASTSTSSAEDCAAALASIESILSLKSFYTAFGLTTPTAHEIPTTADAVRARLEAHNFLPGGVIIEAVQNICSALWTKEARVEFIRLVKADATLKASCSSHSFDTATDAKRRPPLIVTDDMRNYWRVMWIALQLKFPLLVTGERCRGKASLLQAFVASMRRRLVSYSITPEAESSELIGHQTLTKNASGETELEWRDGKVTEAVRHGQLLLLKNLGAGDPKLLERLNPVLERTPVLILPEHQVPTGPNNALEPEDVTAIHRNSPQLFRVLGTLTTTRGGNELTPALFNRFTIVHVAPISSEVEGTTFLYRLATTLLGSDAPARAIAKVINATGDVNDATLFAKRLLTACKADLRLLRRLMLTVERCTTRGEPMAVFEHALEVLAIDRSEVGLPARLPNSSTATFAPGLALRASYNLVKDSEPRFNRVVACLDAGLPMLMVGPPAVGKTEMAREIALARRKELLTVVNSSSTSQNDYWGGCTPHTDGTVVFSDGPLARALKYGHWLLVDELNLAPAEILAYLLDVLDGATEITNPLNLEVICVHPQFRLIATQNPNADRGRKRLPESVECRFVEIKFTVFTKTELTQIIQRCCENFERREAGSSARVASLIDAVAQCGSGHAITLRHVRKWDRRLATLSAPDTLRNKVLVMGYSVIESSATSAFGPAGPIEIAKHFGGERLPLQCSIQQVREQVSFSLDGVSVAVPGRLANTTLFKRMNPEVWPAEFKRALVRFAFAMVNNEPTLLVGNTSFKTLLVRTWAEIIGTDSKTVYLTGETEVSDLLGSIKTYTPLALQTEVIACAKAMKELSPTLDVLYRELCRGLHDDAQSHSDEERTQGHRSAIDSDADGDQMQFSSDDDAAPSTVPNSGRSSRNSSTHDATSPPQKTANNGATTTSAGAVPPSDSESSASSSSDSDDTDSQRSSEAGAVPFEMLMDQFQTQHKVPKRVTENTELKARQFREAYNALKDHDAQLAMRFTAVFHQYVHSTDDRPSFFFKDGPVVDAIQRGTLLVLEDFGIAKAATIERLNPLAETDARLELPEDTTLSGELQGKSRAVRIHPKARLVGTVRECDVSELSPATLSRYTVIRAEQYSSESLEAVIRALLSPKGSTPVAEAEQKLFIECELLLHSLNAEHRDLRRLVSWAHYVAEVASEANQEQRVCRLLQGARLFYVEALPREQRSRTTSERLEALFTAYLPSEVCQRALRMIVVPCEDLPIEKLLAHRADADRYETCNAVAMPRGVTKGSLQSSDCLRALAGIVFTPATISLLEDLMMALTCRASLDPASRDGRFNPVMVKGPPGRGKTKFASVVAAMLGYGFVRINFSADTSKDHLIGGVRPTIKDGKRSFDFQLGKLLREIKNRNGKVLVLLDELNLANAEILDTIAPLLDPANASYCLEHDGSTISLTDVIFVAAMNPVSCDGGRKKLPASISSLFTPISTGPYDDDEVALVARKTLQHLEEQQAIPVGAVDMVIAAFHAVNGLVKEKRVGNGDGDIRGLRDLMKIVDMITCTHESRKQADAFERAVTSVTLDSPCSVDLDLLRKYLRSVLAQGRSKSDRSIIAEKIVTACGAAGDARDEHLTIEATSSAVSIGGVTIMRAVGPPSQRRAKKSVFVQTQKVIQDLQNIAVPLASQRPVLIAGPEACGKTTIVTELSALCNKELHVIGCHSELDVSEIIGSIRPDARCGAARIQQQLQRTADTLVRAALTVDDKRLHNRLGDQIAKLLLDIKELDSRWEAVDAGAPEAIARVETVVETLKSVTEDAQLRGTAEYGLLKQNLKALERSVSNGRRGDFKFEFSPFVNAIQTGGWVLFDNVNAAPQDVIERLLSLLEDSPSLDLYESGEDVVLRPLAFNPEAERYIHPQFRLFFTVDMQRREAARLSAAFLDRLMVVHLDSIDPVLPAASEATGEPPLRQAIDNSEAFRLLHSVWLEHAGIADSVLASELLRFHVYARDLESRFVSEKLLASSQINFRTALQALDVAVTLAKAHRMSSPCALSVALIQTYMQRASSSQFDELGKLLSKMASEWKTLGTVTPPPAVNSFNSRSSAGALSQVTEVAAALERAIAKVIRPYTEQFVVATAKQFVDAVDDMARHANDAPPTTLIAELGKCLLAVTSSAKFSDLTVRVSLLRQVAYSASACRAALVALTNAPEITVIVDALHSLEAQADACRCALEDTEPAEAKALMAALLSAPGLDTIRHVLERRCFNEGIRKGGEMLHAVLHNGTADQYPELKAVASVYAANSFGWRAATQTMNPASDALGVTTVHQLRVAETLLFAKATAKALREVLDQVDALPAAPTSDDASAANDLTDQLRAISDKLTARRQQVRSQGAKALVQAAMQPLFVEPCESPSMFQKEMGQSLASAAGMFVAQTAAAFVQLVGASDVTNTVSCRLAAILAVLNWLGRLPKRFDLADGARSSDEELARRIEQLASAATETEPAFVVTVDGAADICFLVVDGSQRENSKREARPSVKLAVVAGERWQGDAALLEARLRVDCKQTTWLPCDAQLLSTLARLPAVPIDEWRRVLDETLDAIVPGAESAYRNGLLGALISAAAAGPLAAEAASDAFTKDDAQIFDTDVASALRTVWARLKPTLSLAKGALEGHAPEFCVAMGQYDATLFAHGLRTRVNAAGRQAARHIFRLISALIAARKDSPSADLDSVLENLRQICACFEGNRPEVDLVRADAQAKLNAALSILSPAAPHEYATFLTELAARLTAMLDEIARSPQAKSKQDQDKDSADVSTRQGRQKQNVLQDLERLHGDARRLNLHELADEIELEIAAVRLWDVDSWTEAQVLDRVNGVKDFSAEIDQQMNRRVHGMQEINNSRVPRIPQSNHNRSAEHLHQTPPELVPAPHPFQRLLVVARTSREFHRWWVRLDSQAWMSTDPKNQIRFVEYRDNVLKNVHNFEASFTEITSLFVDRLKAVSIVDSPVVLAGLRELFEEVGQRLTGSDQPVQLPPMLAPTPFMIADVARLSGESDAAVVGVALAEVRRQESVLGAAASAPLAKLPAPAAASLRSLCDVLLNEGAALTGAPMHFDPRFRLTVAVAVLVVSADHAGDMQERTRALIRELTGFEPTVAAFTSGVSRIVSQGLATDWNSERPRSAEFINQLNTAMLSAAPPKQQRALQAIRSVVSTLSALAADAKRCREANVSTASQQSDARSRLFDAVASVAHPDASSDAFKSVSEQLIKLAWPPNNLVQAVDGCLSATLVHRAVSSGSANRRRQTRAMNSASEIVALISKSARLPSEFFVEPSQIPRVVTRCGLLTRVFSCDFNLTFVYTALSLLSDRINSLHSGLAEVASLCEAIRTLLKDVNRWSDKEVTPLRHLTASLAKVVEQTQVDVIAEGWSRHSCDVESIENIETKLDEFLFHLSKQRGQIDTFVRELRSLGQRALTQLRTVAFDINLLAPVMTTRRDQFWQALSRCPVDTTFEPSLFAYGGDASLIIALDGDTSLAADAHRHRIQAILLLTAWKGAVKRASLLPTPLLADATGVLRSLCAEFNAFLSRRAIDVTATAHKKFLERCTGVHATFRSKFQLELSNEAAFCAADAITKLHSLETESRRVVDVVAKWDSACATVLDDAAVFIVHDNHRLESSRVLRIEEIKRLLPLAWATSVRSEAYYESYDPESFLTKHARVSQACGATVHLPQNIAMPQFELHVDGLGVSYHPQRCVVVEPSPGKSLKVPLWSGWCDVVCDDTATDSDCELHVWRKVSKTGQEILSLKLVRLSMLGLLGTPESSKLFVVDGTRKLDLFDCNGDHYRAFKFLDCVTAQRTAAVVVQSNVDAFQIEPVPMQVVLGLIAHTERGVYRLKTRKATNVRRFYEWRYRPQILLPAPVANWEPVASLTSLLAELDRLGGAAATQQSPQQKIAETRRQLEDSKAAQEVRRMRMASSAIQAEMQALISQYPTPTTCATEATLLAVQTALEKLISPLSGTLHTIVGHQWPWEKDLLARFRDVQRIHTLVQDELVAVIASFTACLTLARTSSALGSANKSRAVSASALGLSPRAKRLLVNADLFENAAREYESQMRSFAQVPQLHPIDESCMLNFSADASVEIVVMDTLDGSSIVVEKPDDLTVSLGVVVASSVVSGEVVVISNTSKSTLDVKLELIDANGVFTCDLRELQLPSGSSFMPATQAVVVTAKPTTADTFEAQLSMEIDAIQVTVTLRVTCQPVRVTALALPNCTPHEMEQFACLFTDAVTTTQIDPAGTVPIRCVSSAAETNIALFTSGASKGTTQFQVGDVTASLQFSNCRTQYLPSAARATAPAAPERPSPIVLGVAWPDTQGVATWQIDTALDDMRICLAAHWAHPHPEPAQQSERWSEVFLEKGRRPVTLQLTLLSAAVNTSKVALPAIAWRGVRLAASPADLISTLPSALPLEAWSSYSDMIVQPSDPCIFVGDVDDRDVRLLEIYRAKGNAGFATLKVKDSAQVAIKYSIGATAPFPYKDRISLAHPAYLHLNFSALPMGDFEVVVEIDFAGVCSFRKAIFGRRVETTTQFTPIQREPLQFEDLPDLRNASFDAASSITECVYGLSAKETSSVRRRRSMNAVAHMVASRTPCEWVDTVIQSGIVVFSALELARLATRYHQVDERFKTVAVSDSPEDMAALLTAATSSSLVLRVASTVSVIRTAPSLATAAWQLVASNPPRKLLKEGWTAADIATALLPSDLGTAVHAIRRSKSAPLREVFTAWATISNNAVLFAAASALEYLSYADRQWREAHLSALGVACGADAKVIEHLRDYLARGSPVAALALLNAVLPSERQLKAYGRLRDIFETVERERGSMPPAHQDSLLLAIEVLRRMEGSHDPATVPLCLVLLGLITKQYGLFEVAAACNAVVGMSSTGDADRRASLDAALSVPAVLNRDVPTWRRQIEEADSLAAMQECLSGALSDNEIFVLGSLSKQPLPTDWNGLREIMNDPVTSSFLTIDECAAVNLSPTPVEFLRFLFEKDFICEDTRNAAQSIVAWFDALHHAPSPNDALPKFFELCRSLTSTVLNEGRTVPKAERSVITQERSRSGLSPHAPLASVQSSIDVTAVTERCLALQRELTEDVNSITKPIDADSTAVDAIEPLIQHFNEFSKKFLKVLRIRARLFAHQHAIGGTERRLAREAPLHTLLQQALRLVCAHHPIYKTFGIDVVEAFAELKPAREAVAKALTVLGVDEVTNALKELGLYREGVQATTRRQNWRSVYREALQRRDGGGLGTLVDRGGEANKLLQAAIAAARVQQEAGTQERTRPQPGAGKQMRLDGVTVSQPSETAPGLEKEYSAIDFDGGVDDQAIRNRTLKALQSVKSATQDELWAFFKKPVQRTQKFVIEEEALAGDESTAALDYARTAQSASVRHLVDRIAAAFRLQLAKTRRDSAGKTHTFKWALMIDNSGSLRRYTSAVRFCVLVLLEVFSQLELPFVVYGFWQKLGTLYDSDVTPFSYQAGQSVLQRLCFSGGTELLDCLEAAQKKSFGSTPPSSTHHNMMMLITDCFTREMQVEKYVDSLRHRQVNLAALSIGGSGKPEIESFLNQLTGRHGAGSTRAPCFAFAKPDELNHRDSLFPNRVIALLKDQCTQEFEAIAALVRGPNDAPASSGLRPPTVERAEAPSDVKFDEEHGNVATDVEDLMTMGADELEKRAALSGRVGQGAFAVKFSRELHNFTVKQTQPSAPVVLADVLSRLGTRTVQPLSPALGVALRLTNAMQSTTSSLRDALEDMFECNKFTRKRPSVKGSSIHVEGLIKSMQTNFTDPRFFAARTGGGVRDYGFVVAIDTSVSMRGAAFANAMACAWALIKAFEASGMEHYAVALYGAKVRIVKDMATPWSAVCEAALASAKCVDYASNDVDVIRTCAALCVEGREKHIFLFTDGHSTALADDVAAAIAECQDTLVTPIACGYGFQACDTTYGRYLHVPHPRSLADGLRALFGNEAAPAPAQSATKSQPPAEFAQMDDLLETLDIQGVLNNIRVSTVDMCEVMEIDNAASAAQVDIVFCVDLTASMRPYITQVRSAIKGLAGAIRGADQLKASAVRFGVSTFRDVGEDQGPPPLLLAAGTELAHLQAHVDCVLTPSTCMQGGDLPEDVVGGVQRAATEQFLSGLSKTQNRFLILFSDAPQHGREFHDYATDSHPNGVAGGMTPAQLMQFLFNEKVFLVNGMMRPTATLKFNAALQAAAPMRDGESSYLAAKVFDDFAASDKYHFIFAFDVSGSMSGARLAGLQVAFSAFASKRIAAALQSDDADIITVIAYGSSSTWVCRSASIAQARDLVASLRVGHNNVGTGTNFVTGLDLMLEAASATPGGVIPVCVFMTDGEDGTTSDAKYDRVKQLRTKNTRLSFYSVLAYNTDANAEATVRNLAVAFGNVSNFMSTPDADQLAAQFLSVASTHRPVDEIAVAVATQVRDRVSQVIAARCY